MKNREEDGEEELGAGEDDEREEAEGEEEVAKEEIICQQTRLSKKSRRAGLVDADAMGKITTVADSESGGFVLNYYCCC